MKKETILDLIRRGESEIIELKENFADLERIGNYISAMANGAALVRKEQAYIIWGISDNGEIVGTKFDPKKSKKGNELFKPWLLRLLDPKILVDFKEEKMDGKRVVICIITMNAGCPVSFSGQRYIRIDSTLQNLKKYRELERAIWDSLKPRSFEREYAKTDCSAIDIFNMLDIGTYLRIRKHPADLLSEEIITSLEADRLIERVGSTFNITNLGAYTFAKRLDDFDGLKSHAIRVIRYKGTNKLDATLEQSSQKGVIVGFEGLLKFINTLLPTSVEKYEENGQRVETTDYPPLVIRELIANQLVHQDFSIKGTSPLVEIYDNRVEITNPGAPLNAANRLLDLPPISRNEALANLFKKVNLVEERGSGIDKVVITLEQDNLPAPDISARENSTVVILFERKKLKDMTEREKINAIYYHAARLYLETTFMTNSSVRKRFNLTEKQSAMASKIISLAVDNGVVKPYDKKASNKFKQYVPFWANTASEN